jgi:hypothetical protein
LFKLRVVALTAGRVSALPGAQRPSEPPALMTDAARSGVCADASDARAPVAPVILAAGYSAQATSSVIGLSAAVVELTVSTLPSTQNNPGPP